MSLDSSETTTSLTHTVDFLKSFSNADRIRIALLLREHTLMSVTDLSNQLKMNRSSLSYHLVKMRHGGFLNWQWKNAEQHYFLADPAVTQMLDRLFPNP